MNKNKIDEKIAETIAYIMVFLTVLAYLSIIWIIVGLAIWVFKLVF